MAQTTNITETMRFEGISLPVSDVAKSVAFYQQFGFKAEVQQANFALLRLGDGTIGLFQVDLAPWPRHQRELIHIELSVDHLDTLYQQLQDRGIDFRQPPHDTRWERSMHTDDPDGYRLEISEGRRGQ